MKLRINNKITASKRLYNEAKDVYYYRRIKTWEESLVGG
uniref:Uncharacterized protein n=1 Tax=Anguilla anguilla TaxID=7936 RepID=A0A0E9UBG8_ANGAN